MSILEKLKQIRKIIIGDTPEQLAQGIAETYMEKKENGEKNPIDETVKQALNIIEETNDLNKVKEFLISLAEKSIEEKDVSDKIFTKTSIELTKKEDIPNHLITEAVQEADIDVPDKVIDTIIEEGEIEHLKERIKLIENVKDIEIVKKRIKDELGILYESCKDKQDWEVVERVEKIKGVLSKEDLTIEMKHQVHQIVAKKIAENYYDDNKKGTRIYALSEIMPYEEMMENDLPNMVEKEFKIIEEERGTKEGRYTKEKLTGLILDKMADNIAKTYKETGVFAIPQSKVMKNLTSDEEKNFIKSIQNFSRRELSKREIAAIVEQIEGTVNNVQIKESNLISAIKKLPNESKVKTIDTLSSMIEDEETIKTVIMLKDNQVIDKLKRIPREKREKAINSISAAMGEKRLKVAQSSPKFKNATFHKEESMGDYEEGR